MISCKLQYLTGLLILLHFSTLVAQDISDDVWLGWRGQNYGAVEFSAPPINWDLKSSANIVWKSAIDGTGHSSPITDGSSVFITSASKSELNILVGNSLSFIEIFLGLVLIYFTIRNIVFQTTLGNKYNITLSALSISILLLLLFIFVFGNGYFNYSRCEVRGWFIVNVVYSLCMIFLHLQYLTLKNKANRATLFLIFAFPIFSYIIMPSKSHVFRAGTIIDAPYFTAIAILVIPFFSLLLLHIQSILKANIAEKKSIKSELTFLKRIQYIIYIGLTLFAGVGIFYFISHPDIIESANIEYKTLISSTWIIRIALSILTLIVLYIFANRRKQILLLIIVVLSSILLFSILERAISRIDYFKYQLGDQKVLLISESFTFKVIYIPLLIGLIISVYILDKIYKFSKLSTAIPFIVIVLFLLHNSLIEGKVNYSRNVLCYDIRTGEEIWKNSSVKGIKGEIHNHNSLATPTSIILNNNVISYFGDCGLSCVDVKSGNQKWINKELPFKGYYGVGSSPTLYNNRLFLIHGNTESNLITSIDPQNGNIIWQNIIENNKMIYRPPFVATLGGENSIICVSDNGIWIYDEEDGELKGSNDFESIGGDPISSVIHDNKNKNIIYVSGRYKTIAINLDRLSNQDFIAWETKTIGANCASPVIYKNQIFILSDNGILTCLNKNSGDILYKKRFSGYFYSSLCRAGRYLYLTNLDGKTYVFEIGPNELIEKSINWLDESVFASFALIGNKLIIRTVSHLVLIE